MIGPAIDGLFYVLQPTALLFMALGVAYGLFIGFLPGLGGIVAMALLLPFIGGMDFGSALGMLLGAHIATIFGSSITGILFGVPGASKSVATCFDGYPMAQKGEAPRALGASAFGSLVGGIIGAIFLVLTLPLLRAVMLAIGPPEYFMMAVWGLSIIAMFSAGSIFKGLAAAGLGLLIAFIGMDPVSGTPRYTFGLLYLFDGISFPVAVIGLFAVSQMMELFIKGGTVVRPESSEQKSSVWEGVRDCWTHRWLLVRSTLLGLYVGVLPGVGASTGGIAAYGMAVATSKHPEKFGTGTVEGVIAPDCTCGANEGGGLVPTLGFGIPGGESMAILLSAFLALGIAPGRDMLENHMDIVFTMVWVLVLANILTTLIGMGIAKHLAKLVTISGSILFPLVLAVCVGGAYAVHGEITDVIVAFIFGFIGFYMNKYGYSRADMVIGMVLGLMFERYLHISINLYGPFFYFTRPVTLLLLALVVYTCAYPFIQARKKKRLAREGGNGQ
jgi:putative tricarboxylic transport membrane protein